MKNINERKKRLFIEACPVGLGEFRTVQNECRAICQCVDFLTSDFKGARLAALMATKQIIKPKNSPAALGPYNHAVRIGDLLFCAGQIPIDPKDGNLVTGDIKVATDRVLQNIKAILDDQGLAFANVVKSTVFMANLADFAAMNEVYGKYF